MATPLRFPTITLSAKAAARVGRGHLWVFSNEIEKADPGLVQGGEAAIFSPKGEFFGSALYNKHALIAARIYSHIAESFDETLIGARLKAALARRERFQHGRRTYRLVFGESDLLPGLIVDRYEDVLSVQILTLAMEQRRQIIFDQLRELVSPTAIVERSDVAARSYEGLEERKGLVWGKLPETQKIVVNDFMLTVNTLEGQKTGLFLDQVENWKLVERFSPGRKVLDLFCNIGGFSLHARRAGAESVRAVDSSGEALSRVLFNAQENGLTNIRAKEADAFEYVRARPDAFDVIVCDPPAFAKSRKQADAAIRGYRELNRHCLKMLSPGGILITCSCSAAVDEAAFDQMLVAAAHDANRHVRLLPGGGQPEDHAPLLAMPETRYLKVRILEAD